MNKISAVVMLLWTDEMFQLHETVNKFWGVSSPLCVEKTNGEVNICHETTTMVVWIYDGI